MTNKLPPKRNVIGRVVGGYTIVSLLGEGGMGSVYAAVNTWLDKRAAVKIISSEYTEDRNALTRFFLEAKAAAAVDDPNIIDIYDAGEFGEDGMTYILMPLREGSSLESLCASSGPLPLDTAAVIALQIASGLDAVHAIGIVHRDVKPQNVLISMRQRRRYYVTIVDFGIAKLLTKHLQDPNFRTRTKAILGTVGYMAPEQARGAADIDARADIYSLGTIVYRMITGRAPYEDPTIFGLLEKQALDAPFPRPRELRPDLPPAWEQLILDCLSRDRTKRPSTMQEFAHRLARSVTSGEEMMRTLSPRFCADVAIRPQDATLSGDLESSMIRWASASTLPRRRRSVLMPASLAAIGGVLVGGLLVGLVAFDNADPSSTLATGAHGRSVGDSGTTAIDPSEPARPLSAPTPAPPAPAVNGTTPNAAMRPPSPIPATKAPAPVPAPIPGPASSVVSATVVQPNGILVVKAKPWAEVWIDGEPAGQTPVRKSLKPGVHKVRLSGPDTIEDLTVTVQPGKESTVQKKW